METFWLWLSVVQVGAASYLIAALLRWRGARLWVAPLERGGWLPWGVALLLAGVAAGAMTAVGDAEFSRFVGTAALMGAALIVLSALLLRQARGR